MSDPNTQTLKAPPYSLEAEQSLLGALMLDNQSLEKIIHLISENDFFRRDHRALFRAIVGLSNSTQPADAITVSEWLDKQNELDTVGGIQRITALVRNTPSAANIVAYAEIVREHSIFRQLIQVGTEIVNSGFDAKGQESKAVLDQAEQKIFQIAEQTKRNQQGFSSIQPLLAKVIDRIDAMHKLGGQAITGLPTGFTDFDDKTAGLQNGELIIIAGRPSMGKTTFAMNIAENIAIKQQLPIAIFSMEMPGEQLILRMLSSLGRINQQRVRTGQLEDPDWASLTSSVAILSTTKLFIDDTPALTPTEIRAKARRLKREHGLGLIVIDYLQLMQVSGQADNRVAVISEISRSLKSLARELDLPVIALSQLNRNLESRPNKRPLMSDLRESGSIEQDADLIVFIYRDEVYNENSTDKGKAEIIIGKQRNGPIGTVHLTFLGEYTRFDNYAENTYGVPLS